MTPLLWITGIIGGLLIGAGLGLAVLLVLNKGGVRQRLASLAKQRLASLAKQRLASLASPRKAVNTNAFQISL